MSLLQVNSKTSRAPAARLDGASIGPAVRLAVGLTGAFLMVVYLVWTWTQPRGLAEFAYAPFTPEPLPWAPMRGFTYEQLAQHLARALVLGPAILACWIALANWRRPFEYKSLVKLTPVRWAQIASVTSVLATAATTLGLLRGRALIDDELAYSMQAAFLSEGRLAAPEPGFVPLEVFSVSTQLGYTGKYLLGEPLVQIPGVLAGVPALLHPLVLGLTLWAFFVAIRMRVDERVAAWSTCALAISPMVVLTTATGLSHATTLCCVVLAGLGLEWVRAGRASRGALLLGLALGYCVMTRPQVGIPVAAVWGPWAVVVLGRQRKLPALAILLMLGAGWILALGAYNHALTGSALKLPWALQCGGEHYGFGRVWTWSTYEHTPLRALENLGVVLVRFNAWWLGLPWGLLLIGAWLAVGRPRRGFAIWLAAALALTTFEAGYYSTGVSDTGPVYHYEWVLPGSLLAGWVLERALQRWPLAGRWAVLLALLLGTATHYAEHGARLRRLAAAIHDEADAVLATIPVPALVLHETMQSESRCIGWVFDSFPKRFRRQSDRIVTFPRPHPSRLPTLLASYPNRHCWYVHRDPKTAKLEAFPCEKAGAWLNRSTISGDGAALRVHSTAYLRTGYDPSAAIRANNISKGPKRSYPCCLIDLARRAGETIDETECIPD